MNSKLVLIFPPMADPSQPYSALPALTAFLRQHGIKHLRQMDLNIEYVRYILKKETLEQSLEYIETRLNQLDGLKQLGKDESTQYTLIIDALMKAPVVLAGIEAAVEALRDPDCFKDIDRLSCNKRMIHEALQILSAASFPHRLNFSNSPTQLFSSLDELRYRTYEWGQNPYREFYLSQTLPELKRLSPQAIGISITYQGQILPAITLAALIKENVKDVPVILGGGIISLWYDGIEKCPELFQWCDYLIPFEGESALLFLLRALNHEIPLSDVPNLVSLYQGDIRKNPVKTEDIDSLPTPDYRGLPLDRYLSPENVYILYTSRGCYWSRCAFCSVSSSMRMEGGYRSRRPDLIHKDIITILERHHSRYIAFGDDCVAPSALKTLVSKLKTEGPEIYWQCEVRFEEALTPDLLKDMKNTGCLNLIFGLESYSPQTLSLMNKGINHPLIERILDGCRENGIAFNLQFFFGFPGETEMDAKITADFIRRQAHGAATFSFGTFDLLRGSPIEKNPQGYNIHSIDRTGGPLAISYNYTPVAPHAQAIKSRLREELYGESRYPFAGLTINAHTLLFLHHCGTPALAKIYEKGHSIPSVEIGQKGDLNLMECRLILPQIPIVGTFTHLPGIPDGIKTEEGHCLLYDYVLDRMVEISPFLVWFIQQLDGTLTPHIILEEFKKETKKEIEEETLLVALNDLYRKGFLGIVASPDVYNLK